MIRFAALVALASCIPEQEPIGTTEWALGVDEPRIPDVASNGDQVIVTKVSVYMLGVDGTIRWRTPYAASIVDLVIDTDGSVAALSRDGDQLSIARLGVDGQIEYVRSVPGLYTGAAVIVIDARGVAWVLSRRLDETGTWAQFARDGSSLGSGVLDFVPAGNARALPAEGVLVPDTLGRLFEIDNGGAVRWMFEGETKDYVVHENGELTLLTSAEIIRLSADHEARWRRSLAAEAISGLAGGAVILSSSEGFPRDSGYRSIIRVDRDGHVERELVDVSYLAVVPSGAPLDGYRLLVHGASAGDVIDFHDRSVELLGTTLVARRLP